MNVRDFVHPACVLPERATLAEALPSFAAVVPVVVRVRGAWHVVSPAAVVGYPLSRQVIDLPIVPIDCVDADTSLQAALEIDASLLGVEEGERFLGCVDRAALLEEASTASTDPGTLVSTLQARALPPLLHDLANALGVAELALGGSNGGRAPLHAEAVEAARIGLAHAGELVRRIRSLGTAAPDVPEAIDVAAIVERMAPLLRLVAGPEVELALDLAPDLPPASGYARLVERVLLNLVLNARDALAWRGRIAISLAEGAAAPAGERRVWIDVEDDGPGIAASVAATLFDPGVTTRRGSARGIGLSGVRRALARVGGTIDVVPSRLGGAAFRVAMPVADAAVGSLDRASDAR